MVVPTIRATSVDNNHLEVVVNKIRVGILCLSFFRLLQELAHIELKWELVSVVDFDAIPRYHIIFDASKIKGKDRGELLDLRTLCHICLLLACNASEALDNLWPEVSLQALLDALHLIDEHRQVHEFFGHGDYVATLLADNVRVALAEEHLIDEGLIQSALK